MGLHCITKWCFEATTLLNRGFCSVKVVNKTKNCYIVNFIKPRFIISTSQVAKERTKSTRLTYRMIWSNERQRKGNFPTHPKRTETCSKVTRPSNDVVCKWQLWRASLIPNQNKASLATHYCSNDDFTGHASIVKCSSAQAISRPNHSVNHRQQAHILWLRETMCVNAHTLLLVKTIQPIIDNATRNDVCQRPHIASRQNHPFNHRKQQAHSWLRETMRVKHCFSSKPSGQSS